MDDKGKLFTKLGVIGVCLIAAVVFIWHNINTGTPGGVESIEPGQAILTLCVNQSCKAQSEMDKRAYFEEKDRLLRQNQPALACPECKNNSVVRAVRCPKCDYVFRHGSMRNDTADRCPKCRYSQMEVDRKQGA